MVFAYYKILVSLFVIFFISIILFFISYFSIPRKQDEEKLSIYECGSSPFSDTRYQFEVRFYLIAILFIISDSEITFLFPWSVALSSLDLFGWLSMFFFLILLTIGFVYEWTKGALDWE
jgi:NADH-quinone oxidoreductase subunit A